MMKLLLICCTACLAIGFFFGRGTTGKKVIEKNVSGETIRDTITRFVPDTVYLAGELHYKYKYRTDTVYRDVPVVDRDETIKATVEDWNLIRDYKKTLFDNESGRLSADFSVQYNELQCLSYSFTPMCKETTIVKKRVLVPFVATSVLDFNSVSLGGGFFYHNIGFRVEWATRGLNFGVMYKF